MASQTLQVTLGAGATRVQALSLPCREVILQNNTANSLRAGDANVSATRGISVPANGGSLNLGTTNQVCSNLNEIYLFGTENDVIDLWYWF